MLRLKGAALSLATQFCSGSSSCKALRPAAGGVSTMAKSSGDAQALTRLHHVTSCMQGHGST